MSRQANPKYSPRWPVCSGAVSVLEGNSNLDASEQINWGRSWVEFLLYFSLGCRVFGHQLGVLSITGLSGAIIVGAGLVCLVVMFSQREPIPVSLLFVLLINCMANVTDLVLIGMFTRDMLYWMSVLLMACYVVRNPRGALRFECFLALAVLVSVALGGDFASQAQGHERLVLSGKGVGTMFANSNDLAKVACLSATALLFSSLRFKALAKIVCWICALALAAATLLTLSRQGLILLGVGGGFYFLASVKGRGDKGGALVLVILALLVAVIFADEMTNIISGYEYRMTLSSDRVAYWRTAPQDMMDSLMSGKGTFSAYSSGGILPHSTFLWLHLAYGGFCAWTYVAWLVYLAVKTIQYFVDMAVEWNDKMEVLAMFTLFFMAQLTTVFAPGNYGFILAVALLEKRFTSVVRDEFV